MHKKNRSQAGFTLVELIVAIAIFILLATMGMVSYTDFNRRQQVTQSAKEVQLLFRQAQKKARVGDKPTGCDSLRGYRVQSDPSLLQLNLIADCATADQTVETYELTQSSRLSAPIDLTFKVLAGGVERNGGGGMPATVTIQSLSAANRYQYSFQVEAGGSISEGQISQQ